MSDILIVIPNYTGSSGIDYGYMFPIGIGYVVAVLKKNGFAVDVLNLNHFTGTSIELVNESLSRARYKIVATGGNSIIYHELKTIIQTAVSHSSRPFTVLGGPVITTEAQLVFEDIMPDYGVLDQGENTMLELAGKILNGKINEVAGTIYRDIKGNTAIASAREQISDLDQIPFPDFDSLGYSTWLDNIYSNFGYFTNLIDYPRIYPIIGNRGCPFQCTFCFHYERYCERSLDNIFEELNERVIRYRINIICLNDDCFSLKQERVMEFCRRIKILRDKIDWELQWTCQMTVKNITSELLGIMKSSGCNSISFGFESYSPVVLKSMKKPINPIEIDQARELTLKNRIILQANFIFGDVAETTETAAETLRYWIDKCNGQFFLTMIQVYPGSAIYNYCKHHDIINDPLLFIKEKIATDTSINFSTSLTEKEYSQLKSFIWYAIRRYMHLTVPKAIKELSNNHYRLSICCPICHESYEMDNVRFRNPKRYCLDFCCRKCLHRFLLSDRLSWTSIWVRIIIYSIFKWSLLRWKLLWRKLVNKSGLQRNLNNG